MASHSKSVTLTKNGRKITLSIPQDIVQYRAAGWREATETPVADSPQDVNERPAAAPKPSGAPATEAGKGGAQK